MKLQLRMICCLLVLFISEFTKALWPDVRFVVETTTNGTKIPVCLRESTGEHLDKEGYFNVFGGPGQLPKDKDELEIEREQFHLRYATNPERFFLEEEKVLHEIVLSCIEGESPAYLFNGMKEYLELLLSYDEDKVFQRFSISHFVEGLLRFSFRNLGVFRDECGWLNERLFLNVLAEEFDKLKDRTIRICPFGAYWGFTKILNYSFVL